MRKKIVAGNWKMHFTPPKAEGFVKFMKDKLDTPHVDVVLCVPYVDLQSVMTELKGTHIKVGAQNMHYMDEGAYTGEVSGAMLEDMGVPYVIIGHSERREYFNETDETVNKKTRKALSCGLTPIVCIGEKFEQRQSGDTFNVINTQLSAAVNEISDGDMKKVVIAYEPIWAIGTGKTATKEQAEEVCKAIREQIRECHGDTADKVRILYGGSLSAKNASELLKS